MHAIQALVILDEKDIAAAAVMTGDSADEESSVQFILRQIRGTDRHSLRWCDGIFTCTHNVLPSVGLCPIC
jgi:hypothetical protein